MTAPTAAPARIFGAINPLRHAGAVVSGVVDDTQRAANGALLQSAFNTANSQKKYLEIDPVRVEYDCQTTEDTEKVGLYLTTAKGIIGGGMSDGTQLIQYAADHPTLTLGGKTQDNYNYAGMFRDFAIGRGVTGTTNGHGLLLGSLFYAHLERLDVFRHNGLGAIYHANNGIMHRAASPMFSCMVNTLGCASGQVRFWDYQPGGGTGNVFNNLYIGGGGSEANIGVLTNEAMRIRNAHGTVFNQLNIEWCRSHGIIIDNNISTVINGLHFEGCAPITGTFDPSFVRVYAATNLVINGMRIFECSTIAADRSGNCHVFSLGGNASCEVNGFEVKPKSGAVYGGKDTLLRLAKFDTPTWESNSLRIRQFLGINNYPGTGGADVDGSLPFGTFGQFNGFSSYEYQRHRSRVYKPRFDGIDANLTLYAALESASVRYGTLTSERKLILKETHAPSGRGATLARRVGDRVDVERGGGAFNLLVRNAADDTTLFTLEAGQNNVFVWDGAAWSAL